LKDFFRFYSVLKELLLKSYIVLLDQVTITSILLQVV